MVAFGMGECDVSYAAVVEVFDVVEIAFEGCAVFEGEDDGDLIVRVLGKDVVGGEGELEFVGVRGDDIVYEVDIFFGE